MEKQSHADPNAPLRLPFTYSYGINLSSKAFKMTKERFITARATPMSSNRAVTVPGGAI